MGMSRNVLSDLEAIAAMPGLEAMAEAISAGKEFSGDVVSMLIFNAGQWAAGSRNELHSLLATTDTWEMMRKSAARVGRVLPSKPPSQDQLYRFRRQGGDNLGHEMSEAFIPAMRDLVLSTGLLPDTGIIPHRPSRSNVVYGDGTVFKPYSDVDSSVDPENPAGSRAADPARARECPRFYGKKKSDGTAIGVAGVPSAMIGVHGGDRLQRCVLGVGIYDDRDEAACSMAVLDRVHNVYGDRVHGFVYDALLPGKDLHRVMRKGIVPIVDMPNAPRNGAGCDMPAEMAEVLGTRARPINRAHIFELDPATHIVNGKRCEHALWALNGAVVTLRDGEWQPSVDSTTVPKVGLAFEPFDDSGAKALIGTYRVPCRHGSFHHRLDLSGARKGSHRKTVLADRVRPIDITEAMADLRGLRSDVESLFSTIKGTLSKPGRARSMKSNDVHQDLIGAAMWINAMAWDIHAAQHTVNGQKMFQAVTRTNGQRNGV